VKGTALYGLAPGHTDRNTVCLIVDCRSSPLWYVVKMSVVITSVLVGTTLLVLGGAPYRAVPFNVSFPWFPNFTSDVINPTKVQQKVFF
jgi:hypothetical protein